MFIADVPGAVARAEGLQRALEAGLRLVVSGQAGEIRQGIFRAHIWGLPGKPFPQCFLPCLGHGPGADLALPSAGEGVAGAAPGVGSAAWGCHLCPAGTAA